MPVSRGEQQRRTVAAPLVGRKPLLIAIAIPACGPDATIVLTREHTTMNAIAEPIELLEAECNALGLYETREAEDETEVVDETCSQRVLGWTVERIFASCIGTRTAPVQAAG